MSLSALLFPVITQVHVVTTPCLDHPSKTLVASLFTLPFAHPLSACSLLTVTPFPKARLFKSNPQWFPPIYFPPPELRFLSPLCFFSDSFVPSFSPCVNMSVTQVHPGPPLPLPHMLPGLLHPHRPVIPKSVSQSWPLPWIPNSHPTSTRHLYLGVSQAPHTHDSHSARPCSSSYVPYFRKWHLPVSPRHSYHSWPPVTNFSRFFLLK